MRVNWALDATRTAVVAVHSCISLTPVLPITVAVLPACITHWGALPIAAAGGTVRVDWALNPASTAVVRVLACISLTTINQVAVAVLHSRVTDWVALAVAAGGGAEWVSWALSTAPATVVRVHSCVSLTPILPITVAVLPTCVTHWGALPIATSGGAVRVDWALDATPTAVVHVLACIGLTTIHPVAVAVLHS